MVRAEETTRTEWINAMNWNTLSDLDNTIETAEPGSRRNVLIAQRAAMWDIRYMFGDEA